MTCGRLALASALAIALAGSAAWGHSFPPVHTVVVQVEACEVALLVGYASGTGESTERIVARAASQPAGHVLDALRDTLAAYAMAPLSVSVDGVVLAPRSVEAKIGFDGSGKRPLVVVLATYALPPGRGLTVASRDPRSTRISWQDRGGRVAQSRAPAQGTWFSGVASFLLPLAAGGSSCATSRSSSASASASSR